MVAATRKMVIRMLQTLLLNEMMHIMPFRFAKFQNLVKKPMLQFYEKRKRKTKSKHKHAKVELQ